MQRRKHQCVVLRITGMWSEETIWIWCSRKVSFKRYNSETEGSNETSPTRNEEKSMLGRVNSICKGSETVNSLACCKIWKEASMVGTWLEQSWMR